MSYNNYCMEFTNEELEKLFINKFNNIKNINIKRLSEDGKILPKYSIDKIQTICFDGDDENLFVNFLGIETDIFIFDTEIMLIDESAKNIYTSSDIYDNIVYEGELRKFSHQEILELIANIIKCFIDSKGLVVKQKPILDLKYYKKYKYYSPFYYDIYVNSDTRKESFVFQNINIYIGLDYTKKVDKNKK